MRLDLTGRHVDITPPLRRLVVVKLSRLERLLKDGFVSGQVVLTREKHMLRADITLHARGDHFLHGVGSASNWESSIGDAIDKIAQQAQKVKTKWKSRKRRVKGALMAAAERPPEPIRGERATAARGPRAHMPRVLQRSRQTIKPMSVADAAREIEAGDGLVIFRDLERDSISVLYRQRNGELTLVETEA